MIEKYLLKQLNDLRRSDSLCDLELISSDGSSFKVHHIVFLALSPRHYEKYCMEKQYKMRAQVLEKFVLLSSVNYEELKSVVEFMYGKPVVFKSRFEILKRALEKLSMDHLIKEVGGFTFMPEVDEIKTEPFDIHINNAAYSSTDTQTAVNDKVSQGNGNETNISENICTESGTRNYDFEINTATDFETDEEKVNINAMSVSLENVPDTVTSETEMQTETSDSSVSVGNGNQGITSGSNEHGSTTICMTEVKNEFDVTIEKEKHTQNTGSNSQNELRTTSTVKETNHVKQKVHSKDKESGLNDKDKDSQLSVSNVTIVPKPCESLSGSKDSTSSITDMLKKPPHTIISIRSFRNHTSEFINLGELHNTPCSKYTSSIVPKLPGSVTTILMPHNKRIKSTSVQSGYKSLLNDVCSKVQRSSQVPNTPNQQSNTDRSQIPTESPCMPACVDTVDTLSSSELLKSSSSSSNKTCRNEAIETAGKGNLEIQKSPTLVNKATSVNTGNDIVDMCDVPASDNNNVEISRAKMSVQAGCSNEQNLNKAPHVPKVRYPEILKCLSHSENNKPTSSNSSCRSTSINTPECEIDDHNYTNSDIATEAAANQSTPDAERVYQTHLSEESNEKCLLEKSLNGENVDKIDKSSHCGTTEMRSSNDKDPSEHNFIVLDNKQSPSIKSPEIVACQSKSSSKEQDTPSSQTKDSNSTLFHRNKVELESLACEDMDTHTNLTPEANSPECFTSSTLPVKCIIPEDETLTLTINKVGTLVSTKSTNTNESEGKNNQCLVKKKKRSFIRKVVPSDAELRSIIDKQKTCVKLAHLANKDFKRWKVKKGSSQKIPVESSVRHTKKVLDKGTGKVTKNKSLRKVSESTNQKNKDDRNNAIGTGPSSVWEENTSVLGKRDKNMLELTVKDILQSRSEGKEQTIVTSSSPRVIAPKHFTTVEAGPKVPVYCYQVSESQVAICSATSRNFKPIAPKRTRHHKTSATQNQTSATQNETSATQNQTSATLNQTNATQNQTSASQNQTSATQNQTNATQNQTSATQNQTSASQNQTSASLNQTSATQNQTSASLNQTSATQNQTSASQNQTSATQNQTSATQNQTSATQNQTSATQINPISVSNAGFEGLNMKEDIVTKRSKKHKPLILKIKRKNLRCDSGNNNESDVNTSLSDDNDSSPLSVLREKLRLERQTLKNDLKSGKSSKILGQSSDKSDQTENVMEMNNNSDGVILDDDTDHDVDINQSQTSDSSVTIRNITSHKRKLKQRYYLRRFDRKKHRDKAKACEPASRKRKTVNSNRNSESNKRKCRDLEIVYLKRPSDIFKRGRNTDDKIRNNADLGQIKTGDEIEPNKDLDQVTDIDRIETNADLGQARDIKKIETNTDNGQSRNDDKRNAPDETKAEDKNIYSMKTETSKTDVSQSSNDVKNINIDRILSGPVPRNKVKMLKRRSFSDSNQLIQSSGSFTYSTHSSDSLQKENVKKRQRLSLQEGKTKHKSVIYEFDSQEVCSRYLPCNPLPDDEILD